MRELLRALAALAEPPDDARAAARLAAALDLGAPPSADEYTGLFAFQLYPYASVYLGPEGMLGGEARDRVAGFWRALSLTPPADVDHLSTMLALYAQLAEAEENEHETSRRGGWRRARKAFLWEHLLSWLPVNLRKLDDLAPPFYQRWGELLGEALFGEAGALGRQDALPVHLREAPGLIDPRAEKGGGEKKVDDFLQSLLAPARGGMILTRADLARAALQLGVGSRAGERRFVLRTLLAQDAPGVLGWLGEEAEAWAERHRGEVGRLGLLAEAWEAKARAAAALLSELKSAARGVI